MAATSRADNAEAERDNVRQQRDTLIKENTELKAQVAVLEAKTDLNGLRGQFAEEMKQVRLEMKTHSDQDLTTATQQTSALEAVKGALNLLTEQMKK